MAAGNTFGFALPVPFGHMQASLCPSVICRPACSMGDREVGLHRCLEAGLSAALDSMGICIKLREVRNSLPAPPQ